MGNYCEQAVHSRYIQLGLQPIAGQRSPGPPGGRDRRASGRSPAVGTYEGWVTSYVSKLSYHLVITYVLYVTHMEIILGVLLLSSAKEWSHKPYMILNPFSEISSQKP